MNHKIAKTAQLVADQIEAFKAADVDLSYLSVSELAELEQQLAQGSHDFMVSDLRFIDEGVIDSIQVIELSDDPDMLGCFMPWLLADCLDVSTECIEGIQKAGQFEALGELILGHEGALEELQQKYAACDGYGAHFAPDGTAVECGQYVICCQ